MSKEKHVSATPATDWLKAHKVDFRLHTYGFVPHGGTDQAAKELGVDPHIMIKTLIMEDENGEPLVILMHGDCVVSTKNLARQVGRKHIAPCEPEQAQRNSGYFVGGTSPFGTRKRMPVYVQDTVAQLPVIYINGGRRGVIAEMAGSVLTEVLKAVPVHVANPKE
ncbi:aminoacyl-tRNA deacylase [Mesosutterella sp. AGMB02718]|uniref:Cys-tRNA(Pro)/Cys-tRNA(Cys) deacylase n=1 Tax=Mesosutterella faecium TaxID=2925194 RepID=A0ABT7IJF1_9BURK|nr:aminoacyl-tRNA deacylase [Mesosutterella sp. AGMB02718]MDL2058494.1 aminoacyl-tRNA deacylase [Mesosutterella sp. AGMB02718]